MAKRYGYKLLFLVITFNKVERNTKRKFARDIDKLLRAIARKLRDIENDPKITESIGTWYCEPIYNDFSNFDEFKIYIINQSAYDPIFKTITDEWGYKLPKRWHRIKKELENLVKLNRCTDGN